jgi:hypothetical protein
MGRTECFFDRFPTRGQYFARLWCTTVYLEVINFSKEFLKSYSFTLRRCVCSREIRVCVEQCESKAGARHRGIDYVRRIDWKASVQ